MRLLKVVSILGMFFMIKGQVLAKDVLLSKNVFKKVPFSSQYSENGALIRSIDFRSVNDLIPQLEEKFKKILKGQKLKDRNEAHITVVRPPEGKSGFFPGGIGIDRALSTDEMITMFKGPLQNSKFDVKCVGMQKNTKGNIVFYLVVESLDILNIRKKISNIVSSKKKKIPFEPIKGYYPHITIGFIGGDVHGVSKSRETCVADVFLK